MSIKTATRIRHQGVHCDLEIELAAPSLVIMVLTGWDAGEFGDLPMQALSRHLHESQKLQLFIDARAVRGASIEVSSDWARWLSTHRAQIEHISMLTGSPFIQLTATFVRRFAELGEIMRIYTDARAFDAALVDSISQRQSLHEPSPSPKRLS